MDLLLVIDRLEVGPVKVEKKRLLMPYRVIKGEEEVSNELVYTYEEEVFDPKDQASLNLATLIGAQLALNYGLFCREIIFHGPLDATDQRFLLEMMDNTSREIYVNKFLQPNPFLVGDAARIPVLRKHSYTQAQVRFEVPRGGISWKHWDTDKQRHAVLSSGGKDSLLSYGLLKELGKETHPIFVNESGRHWFTAINAYRYFKETEPHTGKVWTNSDRMFAWMLRQLPFVRQDFSELRTDDYPIRLWTVAVFLFGVLPLLRKRQIGRLLIGDEYDSTQHGYFEGIEHYHGYFDQSRIFDAYLSRYFLQKGWSISQFSVLRPLSELLIMKVLVKRYPDLQARQVSCHAAHKDEQDEHIHPCGKCEKCRRIVGMLCALGADPRHCGYSDKQIEESLQDLARHKVKQIGEDARQLYFMLEQKGLLQGEARGGEKSIPHPETLQLRFHPSLSPVTDIPCDLRKPLYEIYEQYTEGEAIRFAGGEWSPYAVLEEREICEPYAFEVVPGEVEQGLDPIFAQSRAKYAWESFTWPEAAGRLQEVDLAILPVGAIEQHGPHLPLDIDAFDARYLAERVALACSDPKPWVLPLIPYGVSYHHDDFPGTLSITNDTLSQLIYDLGKSLARNGIKKLLILNGHGDNAPTLAYAAQMINRDTGIFVGVDTGESSDTDLYDLIDTPNDIHAGEIETSTTLAIRPGKVRFEEAEEKVPRFPSRYLGFSSSRGVPWYAHTQKLSQSGVLGDPTKAQAWKGLKMWEIMIAHLVAFVEDLKHLSLEEIHQKRY